MRPRSGGLRSRRSCLLICSFLLIFAIFCYFYGSLLLSTVHELTSERNADGRDVQSRIIVPKLEIADDLEKEDGASNVTVKVFPVCDSRYTEIVPCLDRNMMSELKLKINYSLMEHYERHCPPVDRKLNCLIPPPPNYKVPVRWPASRDQIWRANVPHAFLATEKSNQHWMEIKGDQVIFPGGGTHFPDGADKYIASLGQMLNNSDGDISCRGKIRSVLDVGCGVASFGAYLLPYNILGMSIAPNDVHENQIQFALERGIPAMLGVLGTMRLPYPSKSFDLAHCSRCRIDWAQRDGILLLELDRLLRPGGYFAWSAPPAYRDDDEDKEIWNEMDAITKRMCWSIAAKEGQTAIWVKPTNNSCYKNRPDGTTPLLCNPKDDPDDAWQVPMVPCLLPMPEYDDDRAPLLPWPKRLKPSSARLQKFDIDAAVFDIDTKVWKKRVDFYWKQLDSQLEHNSIRNIMDMNADIGGFAAALINKPVWVMNVVPITATNTLNVVYDRGLIGTLHNWCESFSTYPRTYDLIHAWDILSELDAQECSLEDLLLEMDRMLRPMGIVIVRDRYDMVMRVREYLPALHWDAWSKEFTAEKDYFYEGDPEGVLMARKQLWHPAEAPE